MILIENIYKFGDKLKYLVENNEISILRSTFISFEINVRSGNSYHDGFRFVVIVK